MVGKRRDGGQPGCRCLHGCLTCIDDAWFRLRAKCRRRRNSYKLYLYHSITLGFSVVTFTMAITLYHVVWAQVKGITETCEVTPEMTTNEALRNYTLTNNRSVTCDAEAAGAAACELQDMRSMLDFMLVNGVTNCIQLVFSMTLCRTFLKFSNLPQERMHFGKTSRWISCGGCLAKWCPWVTRFMHLFQLFALWTLWGMLLDNKCRGDLTRTHNCATFQPDCGYNRLKNCQYYYTFCEANATLVETCFNVEGRAGFSGRMDMRLLTFDTCARCEILKADLANPLLNDEYYLLDEEDFGDPEKFRCLDVIGKCFHTTVWANIACNCESFKNQVNVTVPAIQEWWNALAAGCTRRLTEEDAATSAVEPAQPALEFRRTGGRGAEANRDDPWGHAAEQEASAPELTHSESDLRGDPWGHAAERQAPTATGGEVDRRLGGLSEQACDWAPGSDPEYYYSSNACDQGGSFAYRFGLVYIYIAGSLAVLATLLGQTVRVMSSVEPWFFNPNAGKENIIKKLLRLSGP